MLILRWAYLQYATIHFSIVYHRWSCGSRSIQFVYILLNHYVVFQLFISRYPLKYTVQCPLISGDDNTQKSGSVVLPLIFTSRGTHKTTFVCKMDFSWVTTQLIVY